MPAADRPMFRQDLVAEPVDDGGLRFIDVMDPDSGNVFRFYEVEYSLACAMDGQRDVPKIVQWAKEELGLTPSVNEVRTVIATLGDLGYLDAGAGATISTQTPPQDDYVRPGVVVGAKRASTPVADLELGNAGASAPPPAHELPRSNIELGKGVQVSKNFDTNERTAVDDIPLGVPGRVDMSVDLSDQVGVSAADVKEAVRASQVMKSVDMSPELMKALEDDTAATAARPAVTQRPVQKPVEAPRQVQQPVQQPRQVEARPVVDQRPPVDTRPPKQEPRPEQKHPTAPTPDSRVSPALLVVLAIVVIGAIAFLVWKFAINKTTEEAVEKPPVTAPKPVPPPPPPVEAQKLAVNNPPAQSIKPVGAAQIEMIAADAATVKTGDVIVKFAGSKPIETEITTLERDIEKRVKPELANAEKERDAAQAAGNKAGVTTAEARIADRQKSLDDKQGKLAAKKADLDKLVLKAPVDGKLTVKAKANTKVTPNDELAVLTPNPVLTATFKKAEGGPKSRVWLVTKSDGKKLSCVVATADASGVAIECPADAAAAGTEVTFGGIDTTPPPPTPEIDMDGSGAGSAAKPPEPTPPEPKQQPKTQPKALPKAQPKANPDGSGAAPEPKPEPKPDPAAGSATGSN